MSSKLNIPIVNADSIPFLSTEQMIEVDRLMTDELQIRLIQMMENAGRNLARLAVARFLESAVGKSVVVLAGTGGNGGGALVAARRLLQWGVNVSVLVTKADDGFSGIPKHQLDIVRRLGVSISSSELPQPEESPDLILDGVIGYSLKGNPRGRAGDLIAWANECSAPVLALDVPSGFDAATGHAFDPAITADATMTLALPKIGHAAQDAAPFIGQLFLADIGVPDWVYRRLGLEHPIGQFFLESDIVQLTDTHKINT